MCTKIKVLWYNYLEQLFSDSYIWDIDELCDYFKANNLDATDVLRVYHSGFSFGFAVTLDDGFIMLIVKLDEWCQDVLLHELGHIFTGHYDGSHYIAGDEYEADRWAVTHGARIKPLLQQILKQRETVEVENGTQIFNWTMIENRLSRL